MTTTITDVVGYILSNATEAELQAVYDAAKQRTRNLRTINAAAVVSLAPGTPVRLDGLSPKYLNGLTGTLKSVSGGRATVTLDKTSTDTLRYGPGARRFYIQPEATSYDLGGLPTSTIRTV